MPDGFSPYERWVRRLYQTNLFNPVKLGLDNIQRLHDALGNPMDNVSHRRIRHGWTFGRSFMLSYSTFHSQVLWSSTSRVPTEKEALR